MIDKNTIEQALIKDRHWLIQRLKKEPSSISDPKWQSRLEQSLQTVAQRQAVAYALNWNEQLPVTQSRERIKQAIRQHQVVIVAGETGSGKTTQLPKLCLELGLGIHGVIGHTQPRRIAARNIAERLSEELESPIGDVVGYQMRFQDTTSAQSRIKVMTDGILLAEMQRDRYLNQYDTLIIDEAHERSLNIDFILGYLKQLLPKRPDLKVIITSATLDQQRFAEHFTQAGQPPVPVIEVSGRSFPVEVEYRPPSSTDNEGLIQTIIQCLDEIQALERKQPALTGDVLVFLPTERDIREVQRALSKLDFAHTEFLPLYSRLGSKDQQKIFQKGRGRRVVLSTNVAETSLTVPNIRYVIDSGTARMSRYSYKTKVQRLPIEPISQASANQRKGRCGRIMEGLCFRLYSEEDFLARPEYTDPEIRRTNLASVILQMLSLRLGSIEDFPFLDAPDPRYIRDGYQLLEELQAIKGNGKLSQIGQRLAHLPMEPRFARMLIEAERLGCLDAVLIIVAGLSIQDPRERPTEFAQQADDKHQAFRHESSDFLSYIKLWQRVEKERQSLSQNQLRKWCKTYFLSYQRLREWRDNVQQLQSLLKAPTKTFGESTSAKKARDQSNDTADFIHQAVLSGLLTQVLQQTENKGEYLAVRGKKVGLWPGSVRFKTGAAWLVAAQLLETQKVYAHTLAEVKPGWIEQLGRHMLSLSYQDMFWHAQRGKVIAKEKGSLLGLVIYADKSVDYGKIDPKAARQVFIEQALAPNALSGFGLVEHNQQVLHELEEMEAKLRRRGELLQESQLAQYFDERLPETVWDLKTLRFALEKQPKLAEQLKLEKAWFIEQAGILPDEALFPKYIHYADQRFELSYQLDPSTVEDGAMVRVPNVLLNQLSEADLSWVVPGFLEEKVLFLIKALPKQVRRQFVPAKDYARAIYDRLVAEQRPANQHLHEAVAKALGKMAGKNFASELWQDVVLPSHLLMTVAVTNAKGKILKVSNDLESLQSQFSQTASRFLAQQDDPIIGRKAKQWVFGDLPETVDKRHGKMTITSYVALIDQGSQVEVMLLDQAAQARWKMRLGLRRLFYLVHQKTLKGLEKQLPDYSALGLLYSRVGEASYLYESLCLAACEATFLAPDQPLIYTEQAFLARSAQQKSQLFEQLKRLCASLYQALESHHALKKQLSRAPALLDPVVEDIELVFDELLAKDFLLKADPQALMHYGRYLQACELRWKNLQGNLSRDQREMAILDDLHDQLNEQLERLELPEGELRLPMYWQLQELRVQSFAQQLGTAQPVSAKKIQQAIKKL